MGLALVQSIEGCAVPGSPKPLPSFGWFGRTGWRSSAHGSWLVNRRSSSRILLSPAICGAFLCRESGEMSWESETLRRSKYGTDGKLLVESCICSLATGPSRLHRLEVHLLGNGGRATNDHRGGVCRRIHYRGLGSESCSTSDNNHYIGTKGGATPTGRRAPFAYQQLELRNEEQRHAAATTEPIAAGY